MPVVSSDYTSDDKSAGKVIKWFALILLLLFYFSVKGIADMDWT